MGKPVTCHIPSPFPTTSPSLLTAGLLSQAQKALIDPLTEPEPAAETGPGTSFRPDSETSSTVYTPKSSVVSRETSKLKKNNPYRKSSASSKNPFVSDNEVSPRASYPSPPQSSSPRQDRFSHRQEAFAEYKDNPKSPKSPKSPTTHVAGSSSAPGRRRGDSLPERYPGDKSHRPLEAIRRDEKIAYRAPYLRKHHQIRPDTIDQLDVVGGNYHHEGPFDATYMARNTSYVSSPLEALARSNEEALKATPKEKIIDSIERHRPLDGVAIYPPGEVDRNGQVYNYEPGENLMIDLDPEGGAYKRWPGVVRSDSTFLPLCPASLT